MFSLPADLWWGSAVADLPLPCDSFLLYSKVESEDRANVPYWDSVCASRAPSSYAVIVGCESDGADRFVVDHAGRQFVVDAFDLSPLVEIVPREANLVLDISGVDHMLWAGCMVEFKSRVLGLYFIYTEPSEYRVAVRPKDKDLFETGLFDLSDRSRGVRPLPRFANLRGPELHDDRSVFVPLLGFEGRRALNVLSGLDPTPPEVIPVVGVPGYRLDFPSYTIACNEVFFRETRSQGRIRYAPAADPFGTRNVLRTISEDFPDAYMYVAPIGTRPHALGALMFADEERERSEILFDHPVRKRESRRGAGKAHLYRIL